jgi:hypothetical protein
MGNVRSIAWSQIEKGLDELIAHQRSADFQRAAIRLAQARCPELIASELSHDGGEDAFTAHAVIGGRGGLRRVPRSQGQVHSSARSLTGVAVSNSGVATLGKS